MIESSAVCDYFKDAHEYIPLSRTEGSLLWDRNGKKYIDFTSGWNVTNLGWNNSEVNEAIKEQLGKNVHGLLWGSDPVQEEYAAKLTAALPKELDACVKATGGTEAVEESIKLARVATGRKKILGFRDLYHGQLFASLALGGAAGKGKIAPLVPDIVSVEFPDIDIGEKKFQKFLEKIEDLLCQKDVAAIVTEPGIVTGWGSTLMAYPGFLQTLRELTAKYGTLLIIDEVGTGFSRTGKLFAIEREGIVPDAIILAKGISNGAVAIGAMVGKSSIFKSAFPDAVLISTFGWTPLACAAALKTLEIHQRDRIWEMAEKNGNYLVEKLKSYLGGVVIDVSGKGMEVGVRFKDTQTRKIVQRRAFDDGLHAIVGNQNNMQIMPPLTIPRDLLDTGIEILGKQISRIS